MFYLTRCQARTAVSAAAGAAVYLAASQIGKDKLKLTGLFVLASASMAGMVTAKASAKSYNVERRFNHLLTNGGTFGGNVTVNGNHTVTGTLHGTGGVLTVGDAVNMQANDLQTVANIHGNGTQLGTPDGISLGNSLIANTNSAFTFSHITSNQIGPGGDRAGIGSGATLSQCATRCDFLLTQLEGAGICY